MKIYISGAITNNENFLKEFEDAEKFLIDYGHTPVNPVKLPHEHDKTWQSYMKEDIAALCGCECIYMIHGWDKSKGANLEHQIASNLGMEVYYNSLNLPL